VAKRPLLTRITRPKRVLQSRKRMNLQTTSSFDHCDAAGSAGGSSMAAWPPPLGGAKRA
jgi:hypothetical protein